jgi:hypothetical protein
LRNKRNLCNSFYEVPPNAQREAREVRHRIEYNGGSFLNVVETGSPAMITIHIVQSGSHYSIGKFHFEDVAGLVMYLKARGVSTENILKILEELALDGEYTIELE